MKSFTKAIRILLPLSMFIGSAAQAAPALWVVSDTDSTVYLFGTQHALPAGMNWRTSRLDAAMRASATLWLEAESNSGGAGAIVQQRGLDPANPLETKLSPAQKTKLDAVLVHYGVPAAKFAPMRPWLAAMTLAQLPLTKAGLDAKNGADLTLKALAEEQSKPIEGFETMAQQVGYLADLPEADQIAFLEDVINRAARGVQLPTMIAAAWQAGDIAALETIVNVELKQRSPRLYTRLVSERNVRYAARIQQLLAGNKDQFVAVGVGHLVGTESIQVALARKGLKVRRIE
ncbi:TraB/GumN family protein [Allosphingosinicella deserti]|nr:TraB/GumN family protein [Sphingomonas deserti]